MQTSRRRIPSAANIIHGGGNPPPSELIIRAAGRQLPSLLAGRGWGWVGKKIAPEIRGFFVAKGGIDPPSAFGGYEPFNHVKKKPGIAEV